MKSLVQALFLSAALLSPVFGHAQTLAPASTKAVTVANPMATSAPAASAAPAAAGPASVNKPAASASKPAATLDKAQAPGGGDGKVWVNTSSNVYHCAGTRYYGKTKAGLYMTPAEAKAKGNHANKGCP